MATNDRRIKAVPRTFGSPTGGTGGGGTTTVVTGPIDGDYGDVIISGTGTVWTIDPTVLSSFAPVVHTHTASQITDFGEAVDDRISSTLVAGANITLTYDDALNTLTVAGTGGLTDGDKGDITVSSSGTVWNIDSGVVTTVELGGDITAAGKALLDDVSTAAQRTTLGLGTAALNNTGDFALAGHTHLLSNITDVTMTVANLNSLDDGINSTLHFHNTDRDRANHTGTQVSSTISDFNEASQDATGAMVDGSLVYVDATPLLSRAALTGDITATQGSNATSLTNDAVLNTKLANMAVNTIKGRITAGTGDPEDLTAAQVRTIINVADGATANQSDAFLLNRANHTGTQAVATITGLATVATSGSAADLSTGTLLAARFPAFTGDVTTVAGTVATTISNDAVTNVKLSNVPSATIKGRVTAGSGDPEDLTGTQATTLLDTFTSALKGLAPASGGGTVNFLRADGTWAPAGGAAGNLDSLTDVIITAPATGQVLKYNGTNWINDTDATGAGGSGASGITTVNFGAFPGASDTQINITGQAAITGTSKVKAWIMPTATVDHTADEHWVETIDVLAGNVSAGVGFTIYAKNTGQVNETVPNQSQTTRLAGPGTGLNQIRQTFDGGSGTRIYGQFTVAWEWS